MVFVFIAVIWIADIGILFGTQVWLDSVQASDRAWGSIYFFVGLLTVVGATILTLALVS